MDQLTPQHSAGTAISHKIPRPYGNGWIVVYGLWDGGSYEYRIIDSEGEKLYDTVDAQYGASGIALRDALIYDTE